MPYYTCGNCGKTGYSSSALQYLKDKRCAYCWHEELYEAGTRKKKQLPDFWAIWVICLMFIVLIAFNGWAKRELAKIDADLADMRQDLAEMRGEQADKQPKYEVAEPSYYRNDIPLDYELQDHLFAATEETGVPYELALAVIRRETDFRNIAGDGGDSAGYMQVQERWHSDRMDKLGVTDLTEPLSNFRVGCDYLAELMERFDLEDALTCYNSGRPGTSQYAKAVIGYMEDYCG